MIRRLQALIAGASLALILSHPAAAGASTGPGQVVNFLANCRFSHFAPDDPIVFPAEPGRSHDHTFFGNTTTDAFSTLSSLRQGQTTCSRKSDTAAYWVPTLYQAGRRVRPSGAIAYYTLRQFTRTQPYPPGLKMVAGDAHATRPQSLGATWWNCGPGGGAPARSEPPDRCPGGQLTRLGADGRQVRRGNSREAQRSNFTFAFPTAGTAAHSIVRIITVMSPTAALEAAQGRTRSCSPP
jgi:uncharacterized protein DUF1996